LERAVVVAGGTALVSTLGESSGQAARKSPNEKLNIACIGVHNQGAFNLGNVTSENIVALCDIDENLLGPVAAKFPGAKKYSDYRKMLDQPGLDAVVVATPDHSHAIPTMWALRRGLDVYCEKPLAHTVWEIRQMRNLAAEKKAVTQMGTQIHAGNNYRRVVEIVKSGMLGKVTRVLIWNNAPTRPGKRVAAASPPANVDYDLWIGPAPMRPYDPSHFHYNWRYWWDFGGGVMADMACHYMDLPFWALDLRYPTSVVAKGEKTYQGDNNVPDNMQADFQFPARGPQPAVHLTWYHGTWRPEGIEKYQKSSAVLFEGERGRLLADYSSNKLYMEPGQGSEIPSPSILNSIGHHKEWIEACKTRGSTTCNFDYSGALAEAVLLGNVSYRLDSKQLDWDPESLRCPNAPEAGTYLKPEYRKGWSLEG